MWRKLAENSRRWPRSPDRQQNILLINISKHAENQVINELNPGRPARPYLPSRAGTVACTGRILQLALTETKSFARWLSRELEERLPGFEEQDQIAYHRLPNSCGQHWIAAHRESRGKKIKANGKMVDAYYFCVGEASARSRPLARPVGYRLRGD